MLEHVIEAAERGVRVRIVVDDTLFLKGKSSLADLSAHPNIEIRVFNPWATKGAARAFETVARAKKLNRRMHDKLLIADNQMAILGGRNIGDHYFGLHHKYNFHDLDMVVVGDAAGRVLQRSSTTSGTAIASSPPPPSSRRFRGRPSRKDGRGRSRSFATPMN